MSKQRKIRVRIVSKAKNAILAEFADRCGGVKNAAKVLGVCYQTYLNWLNFRSAPIVGGKGTGGRSVKNASDLVLAIEKHIGVSASQVFNMTKDEMGLFRDARTVTKEISAERLVEHLAETNRSLTYESNASHVAENEELKERLSKTLNTMTARERAVLERRFGLNGGHPMTLKDTGRDIGVTRERVRQIEAKAIRKLQQPSRSDQLVGFLK